MKLYGALLSPFVRKVALVATEKGIDYQLVMVSPHGDHAEFAAASPFGKIPAMADGDYTLADSSAIVAYLEAKHPENPMIPADPQARGKAIWYDEFADTILGASGLKILFNRLVAPKLLKLPYSEEVALQGETELAPILAWFEGIAPERGWLLGETFSLADISIASIFRSLGYVGHAPDAASHPNIAAWYARVCERPAWMKVAETENARRG